MKILISNDDGISADGLVALANAVKKIGKGKVVAPQKEQSTCGHSLTLHKPLRLISQSKKDFYAVSGRPADCIQIGCFEFGKPDLVVSGINRGANMGQDVFYSGTVSAAREAAIMGVPAVAFSLAIHDYKKVDFKAAEKVAAQLLLGLHKAKLWQKWPKGMVMNVNIPQLPMKKIKGFRFATQGRQLYSGRIIRRRDNRGRNYYWIGGRHVGFAKIPGSDCALVAAGYVAVSLLHLDTSRSSNHTDYNSFKKLLP